MDDETAAEIMRKLKESHAAYSKGMEMVGYFSAATIGVVIALRPHEQGETQIQIQIAVVLLFVSVLSTIFWFFGKGTQHYITAKKIMENPSEAARTKELPWARASRVIALSAFISAYFYLYISL
ncbi:MAG: hypothetical protein KBT63_09030 [Porticoccaceae bacterium]|nr:hypothetical protein [Porticoccaceae bacterium]